MKKLLISMCMALVGLCASAQEKGDMAAGLNLGVAPSLEKGVKVTNFGIGAKFQYNVSTPVRLEADVEYWLKSKGLDVLDVSANIHYLFNVGGKLKVYPLVGIGYARIAGGFESDDDYDYGELDDMDASMSKLLVNAGLGLECPITKKIAVGAEVKYQYIKHFSRLPVNIGITYKF